MDEVNFLEILIEDLKNLRLELEDHAEVETLVKIDRVIVELEASTQSRDGPTKLLTLLGIIFESLPSIIRLIDSLTNRL